MSSTSLHCRSHVRSSVPPRCVSHRTVEFRPRLAAELRVGLWRPQLSAAAIRALRADLVVARPPQKRSVSNGCRLQQVLQCYDISF